MYQFQQMPYYQNPQIQPQRAENNLIRVTGIEGAKAYQMGANSCIALFDSGNDVFYVKTTDGAGFPTIRTFRFEPVDSAEPVTTDQVTREDLERFKQEVTEHVQQLIQQSTTTDVKHKSGSNK